MGDLSKQSRRDEQRLKEWQFLLLRFAITRDPLDQAAALAVARPLDEMLPGRGGSFSYFSRTTTEICAIITGIHDERRRLTLQGFIARVDDDRLKAAFSACLEIKEEPSRAPRRAARRDRQDLWRGLPKR